MQHDLLLRLLARLGFAGELPIHAARKFHFGIHLLLRVLDEARDVAAVRVLIRPRDVARHGLAAARALVRDERAARGGINVGEFAQRQTQSGAVAQQQAADLLRLRLRRAREDHRDVRDLIAAIRLRDNDALIRRLHALEHLDRPEAVVREPLGPQLHGDARAAGRRLHLHVFRTGDFRQHLRDFSGALINRLEVFAKNIHHHGGRFARDAFADAVAEESQHLALNSGILAEQLANFLHQMLLLLAGRSGDQLDVKFAAVRAPRVLALRRASDLLLDGRDVVVGDQLVGNLRADAEHFFERRAGRGGNLQDEMPLAERRQKLLAHVRQLERRRRAHEQHEDDHDARRFREAPERADVKALEPRLQPRLLRLAHAASKHHERQRRRERERDQQRHHDRDDVSQRERREEFPLQPREREHRHKHERDDERGEDDRRANLERRVEDHFENCRSRREEALPFRRRSLSLVTSAPTSREVFP